MEIDPVAALRSWIIDNGGVGEPCEDLVALVGGAGSERIYSPSVPRDEISAMPRETVTYYLDDSTSDVSLPLSEMFFEFRCYGPTDKEAGDVFRALNQALDRRGCIIDGNVLGSRTLGFTCFRAAGPTQLVEPETAWPFVRAVYRLRFWEDLT